MKRMLLFLMLLVLAQAASAAVTCSLNGGTSFTFSGLPSTLTLSTTPAVGTALTSWNTIGSAVTYTCNNNQIYWDAVANLTSSGQTYTESGLTYTIYQTGIQGVGVVLRGNNTKTSIPLTNSIQRIDGMNNNTQLGTSLSARLVVTGTIAAGSYPGTIAATTYIENAGSYSYSIPYYLPGFTLILAPPTCSVSTTSLSVSLGAVPVSSFSGGIGSTSPEVPFNLAVNCGTGARTADIYVTLTDQTNTANRTDTLGLTADSTASGVGVQVLNGTTVISYGPDSSLVGNTNQWFAATSVNGGTRTIPLRARYVRNGPSVKPGSANARATFTMSYQ